MCIVLSFGIVVINIFPRSEPSFHPISFFPPVNSDVFDKLKEQYAMKHNISMELSETIFPDFCSTDMERLIQTAKENIQCIKQAKQARQENATQALVTQGKKSRH